MSIANYIDHTNLNENATEEDIKKLCQEAIDFGFFGVCIYPKYIKLAKSIVKDKCKVVTVISFPQGNDSTEKKVEDTKAAISAGADEIDMVINKEALLSNKDEYVLLDIEAVVKAASGKIVKVIIETAELNEDQLGSAVNYVVSAKAHFVKTSTGKSPKGGATEHDVKAIKGLIKAFNGNQGIKAAGGIRDYKTAKIMIDAGATRVGCSASIQIINEEKKER